MAGIADALADAPPPSESDEDAGAMQEAQESAATDFADAVASGDAASIVSAFKALSEACREY